MNSLVLVLGLFVLPVTPAAFSEEAVDESNTHLEQFYDVNMEVLASGEIAATPRIILKVGGSGSVQLSSERDNYLIAIQTEPPQIASGVVQVPISFDFKYETAGESQRVNTVMNLPLGRTVSLGGKPRGMVKFN